MPTTHAQRSLVPSPDCGSPWPAGAPLLLLCALGCAGVRVSDDSVEQLIGRGEYARAVREAAALVAEEPGNEALETTHRRATAAFYLARGRELTFLDQDAAALVEFESAAAALPGDEVVQGWIDKSRLKLAERCLRDAQDRAARDDLEGAGIAYESALEYWPGHERAARGLAKVLVQINYREGVGEDYYLEGVRALREFELNEAHKLFGYVPKYLGPDERARRRDQSALSLIAEERVLVARSLTEQGLFAAANNEFRFVLLLDPNNPSGVEGLASTQVEVEVQELRSEVDMLIRRGRLAEARERAQSGLGLSSRQDLDLHALLERIGTVLLDQLYDEAYALEQDFRYEGAVDAYQVLLEESGGYYRDALTRSDTLTDYIDQSRDWYEQAAQAETSEQELEALLRIQILWPEYRDVDARIEALSGAMDS